MVTRAHHQAVTRADSPQVSAGDTAIAGAISRVMGRKRRQHGQAMIEALIACALVLVPLFLAIPVLAKYMDIKAYTVQAARYAAWERTVWFGGDAAKPMGIAGLTNKWDANEKSDDTIRTEIAKRLLADSGTASFVTNESMPSDVRPLWRDRRSTALVAYNGGAVGIENDESPGLINDILSPVVSVASVISNFTLETNAQYTAVVGVQVKQVAFNVNKGMGRCTGCPPDFLATSTPLNFTDKNVIVANGWSANGPGSWDTYDPNNAKESVYDQVRGITPTAMLKPADGTFFDTVLDVLKGISLVFFPELSTLDLGRVDVDKVPGDRLQ
jgi:hypothetical protein